MIARILCAFGALSVGAASAWACRFNVRDVGFVDLGGSPYKFHCLVSKDTPQATATSIKQISTAAFLDTNVEAEIADLGEEASPEILGHYEKAGKPELPVGILVSGDGKRSFAMPLVRANESLDESLWSAMESTFESSIRDRIIEKVIEHYCVIVLVEGIDDVENQRAQEYADSVIRRIEDR